MSHILLRNAAIVDASLPDTYATILGSARIHRCMKQSDIKGSLGIDQ